MPVDADCSMALSPESGENREDVAGTPAAWETKKKQPEGDKEDVGETAMFTPALWRQRRTLAAGILRDREVTSVLDFGCGEGSHLAFLIPCGGAGPNVVRLAGVDIDPEEVRRASDACKPWETDFAHLRHSPLIVELYEGSVADTDDRLREYDAAICIEVIEHLDPPVLAALPKTLFGDYCPKVVIISTPNVEFNVHFHGLKLTPRGDYMRHDDHRFEWTRAQFEEWCTGVGKQYGYAVRFTGVGVIGEYDPKTGCCTQVCIFDRLRDAQPCALPRRSGPPREPYRLAVRYEFPWYSEPDVPPAETLTIVKEFIPYFCTALTSETHDNYLKLPPRILEYALSGRKLYILSLDSLWSSLRVRQLTRNLQNLRELLEGEPDSFTFVLPPERDRTRFRVLKSGVHLSPKQYDAVLLVVHVPDELESFAPNVWPDPSEEEVKMDEEEPSWSDEDGEWNRSEDSNRNVGDDEQPWEVVRDPPEPAEEYASWNQSTGLWMPDAASAALTGDERFGWGDNLANREIHGKTSRR